MSPLQLPALPLPRHQLLPPAAHLIGSGAWSHANMRLWNEAQAETAARYPNLRLFDWAPVVDDARFGTDEIHHTSRGYALRGRLIADALAAQFPAGS